MKLRELLISGTSFLASKEDRIGLGAPRLWEDAKDHVFISVCSVVEAKDNNWVHERIGSLALVPRILVNVRDDGETLSEPVSEQLLLSYGLSRKEIIAAAKANGKELFPPCVLHLRSMSFITSLHEGHLVSCGAGALFYPGVLEELTKRLGNFYVLPSSKAEFALIPVEAKIEAKDFLSVFMDLFSLNTALIKSNEKPEDSILLCSGGKLFKLL